MWIEKKTKVHPGLNFLEDLKKSFSKSLLKPIVLVSLSPLKSGIEKASVTDRVKLIYDLQKLSILVCWYIRPLVKEWFDKNLFNDLALDIIPVVKKNIIISSLIATKEIERNLQNNGIIVPNWEIEKEGEKLILPKRFEKKIIMQIINIGKQVEVNIGAILSHRICGANRYSNFACKLCKPKEKRFCQNQFFF